ncbi:hypothetical protein [Streptomyces sp. NPDC048312]
MAGDVHQLLPLRPKDLKNARAHNTPAGSASPAPAWSSARVTFDRHPDG